MNYIRGRRLNRPVYLDYALELQYIITIITNGPLFDRISRYIFFLIHY